MSTAMSPATLLPQITQLLARWQVPQNPTDIMNELVNDTRTLLTTLGPAMADLITQVQTLTAQVSPLTQQTTDLHQQIQDLQDEQQVALDHATAQQ